MGLLLQAWLLFPAALFALCVGLGLLVERLSAARLPGVLIVPLGLAALFVLARLAMATNATAELATPVVGLAALAGVIVGRERLRAGPIDRWAAGAALVTFAVYAAPIVLSGQAGFLGYTILGDTAVHFILVDRIATHGTELAGLGPSSYRSTLESYFGSGYPLGAHAALGAVRPLAFADVAWVFQPFLACITACLALTLAGLLRGLVRPGWRAAAVCVIAAQPAIVYSYAAQGSVKELATLWLVALLAAVLGWLWTLPTPGGSEEAQAGAYRLGHVVPLAVAAAAGISAVGLAVAPWLGPVALVALVAVLRSHRRSPARVAGLALGFAALAAALSLPTLLEADRYLAVTRSVVTAQTELGNLSGPLGLEHVLGIWLSGDYRAAPRPLPGLGAADLQAALLVLAAVSAAGGAAWLVARRAAGPLVFVASSLIALAYVTRSGSPWADAKALAIAAPAVVLAAALGAVALEALGERRGGRLRLPARLAAGALALALAAGVTVSNAFTYHDASLAPLDRFQELAEAGARARGDAPLLYTEFEEFGKHFLREARPVGASEAFNVPGLTPELRTGGTVPFATGASPSALKPSDLERFASVVARRSPDGTRPPGRWERAWRGRFFDLWARPTQPPGPPSAACPGRAATLRPKGPPPAAWAPRSEDPPVLATSGPGTITGRLDVRRPGRYGVWLLGSFGRGVEVSVDGDRVGAASNQLTQPYGWVKVGTVRLDGGRHRARLARGAGTLAPGSGGGPRSLGPLALSPAGC